MASNALISRDFIDEIDGNATLDCASAFDAPFNQGVSRRFSAPFTAPRRKSRLGEPVEVDLGLRAGIKIKFQPHKDGQLPPAFTETVAAIKQIENLEPNWDSYGALPLDERAVKPAIELAMESTKRCASPHVVPLPTGGIGLRWASDAAELEVDVTPDGKVTFVLEYLDTGTMEESDDAVDIDQALPAVRRFFSLGN